MGAQAVLLICSLLSTEQIREYIGICNALGMSALVEANDEILEKEHRLPDAVIACVGGGSNAIGSFYHFIDDDHVSMILKAVRNMKADGYYAKMAAAWLAAECAVNYTGLVVELLKEETLDAFVHNKTISKMCESYKIPQDVKQHVRSMRVNSIVGGGKQI